MKRIFGFIESLCMDLSKDTKISHVYMCDGIVDSCQEMG